MILPNQVEGHVDTVLTLYYENYGIRLAIKYYVLYSDRMQINSLIDRHCSMYKVTIKIVCDCSNNQLTPSNTFTKS